MKRMATAVVVALVLVSGCGGGTSTPPSAARRSKTTPTTAVVGACATPVGNGNRLEASAGTTYFGVNLDWEHDSPAAYAGRLGRHPAVYVAFASFPMDASAAGYIDGIAGGLVGQKAALMLTLEPFQGLAAVTDAAVTDLAARLGRYNREGVPVFVRFAHEMNGSWYPWSQQPAAYVAAFRRLATAVHAEAPATATVWAPNYGGGYPFTGGKYEAKAGTPDRAALDTDHDGKVTMADDAYAPYYPGDDAVDWVGMSLYHWGNTYPWGANGVPEPGKFAAFLTGTYRGTVGDETPVHDFYAEFADGHHKPVSITETAAFYAPGRPGNEAAIKQAWWQQVFDPAVATRFPQVKMVNWFEWDKHETEVNAEVDWSATHKAILVGAFRAALPSRLAWAGSVPGCAAGR